MYDDDETSIPNVPAIVSDIRQTTDEIQRTLESLSLEVGGISFSEDAGKIQLLLERVLDQLKNIAHQTHTHNKIEKYLLEIDKTLIHLYPIRQHLDSIDTKIGKMSYLMEGAIAFLARLLIFSMLLFAGIGVWIALAAG